ncbi:unnamed protein product [Phyllotreta striolata]|uniref:Phospholipase B1, membrane-associated n=1 Tax=Phyllotreta striolata TaxID=444603 RepID=A0A9N9TXD4_PHYSR|nr:unnamed protein product [Phyllotreta striolata]
MFKKYSIILLVMLATPCIFEERTILDDTLGPIFRNLKLISSRRVKAFMERKDYNNILNKTHKAAKKLSPDVPFPCDLTYGGRSKKVPTTVHELRPGDIDIVGNLGDSLSAGTGISAVSIIQGVMREERGRSFTGGGEKTWRTYLTLPNILKVFNPALFGYALGGGPSIIWESQFNVAENGATSENMPYMSRELVKRIRHDPRTDVKNHWKMVTLMIGDNDFCNNVCYFPNYYDSLEQHRRDLLEVLRYLRDNLPRTIVNVIPPPRLDVFYKMEKVSFQCYLVQNFACPCIKGLTYKSKRKILSDIMKKWQLIQLEVCNLPEFDLDDFTVIPHQFTLNYTFPTTPDGELDFSVLAPDCFHFSEKGQARVANDLWNSILEPFGNKSTDGRDVFAKFNCPTADHPFIFTRRNSPK